MGVGTSGAKFSILIQFEDYVGGKASQGWEEVHHIYQVDVRSRHDIFSGNQITVSIEDSYIS